MMINFSLICQIFSGSGQILHPGQLYRSPGLAKIAPWWLDRRDSFSAKVQHDTTADSATNAYCTNPQPLALRPLMRQRGQFTHALAVS
jgi:hypothetical protein